MSNSAISGDPSLLDPVHCGEDLAHNAARFSALAPLHCDGCADYHIRSALHRYAGPRKLFDRPELIRLASRLIAEKAVQSDRTIEIVIAGAADTAMLATCAHAAATLGAGILGRCRFTVLDRCTTPLLICAEFAARHGLDFAAQAGDLLSAVAPCAADLIVTHSVFRFIPHEAQATLLRRIGNWLAPGGRLILSNRILLDDDGAESKGEMRKRTAANAAARQALAEGRLTLSESAGATLDRLERAKGDGQGRPGEFRSLAEVRSLIRKSGLMEISVEELAFEFAIGPGDVMHRRRVHAVLGRSGEERRG
ncbi:class I SAM-dependent methyltransferase [Taklimakanibacter lacteus]|uniref:class I SAM-dependent methyltransferase n=1 Tax=Taklimakanibacter lacteus TaxID=2268456 RepID=UPI000E671841